MLVFLFEEVPSFLSDHRAGKESEGDSGSSGLRLLEADHCLIPAEVYMVQCESGVQGCMTSREKVKWVEGVRSHSEFQMKRELKIYASCFVFNSRIPLVGVISTAAFLLKWARRNSRAENCSLWGQHSDRDIHCIKKNVEQEVAVSSMPSNNLT